MGSLTGREPYTDMFESYGDGEAHVELARRADVLVIAPASATTMARLAHGLAEDFLALTALATTAPVLLAPAMDTQMWEHNATQANRDLLASRGVTFIGPAAPVQVLVPTAGDNTLVGTSWTSPTFAPGAAGESAWTTGASGVGYSSVFESGPLIGTDVQSQMHGQNASSYVRVPFEVPNAAALAEVDRLRESPPLPRSM